MHRPHYAVQRKKHGQNMGEEGQLWLLHVRDQYPTLRTWPYLSVGPPYFLWSYPALIHHRFVNKFHRTFTFGYLLYFYVVIRSFSWGCFYFNRTSTSPTITNKGRAMTTRNGSPTLGLKSGQICSPPFTSFEHIGASRSHILLQLGLILVDEQSQEF